EPVGTPFGFHAIKVLEARAGGKKPLKDVAPQIRDRLAAEAADKAARAKADEVRRPLQAAKDFVAEARRLGLTPIETTMSRMERLPMLGGTDPLEEAVFALAIGGVSSPVKTPAGWVVLKSTEAIPAGVPPLTEIRDKVAGAVKRQKAEAVALERAHKVVAETGTKDLAAAAKIAGAQKGETARFSRTKPAERLPGDVQLAALQSPAGTVAGPVKSPQGYYVLKVLELDRLKRVERPTIIKAIAEARAHGDLSENAEYHAAREKQSFIEGRINELEGKVNGAEVIEAPKGGDRVTFASTVRLEDEAGKEVRYWIVGSDEADPAKGRISIHSPLARTLIGKRVGDSVTAQLPGSKKTFEILEVNFGWTE